METKWSQLTETKGAYITVALPPGGVVGDGVTVPGDEVPGGLSVFFFFFSIRVYVD